MSRMFKTVTKTWNPVIGCLHDCVYCWARDLAEGKLKVRSGKYVDGFEPRFFERELTKKFKPGQFVFVSDMGDLYGKWVPRDWILRVLAIEQAFPEVNFLNQTKNPERFHEFWFPPNAYLGTTIETNRDYGVTKAPSPATRYLELWIIEHPHKFVSIEPIMDFDLDELVGWMRDIKPDIIEIGADNYGHGLPEPPWEKVERLLQCLRQICPRVVEKDGLERLKG